MDEMAAAARTDPLAVRPPHLPTGSPEYRGPEAAGAPVGGPYSMTWCQVAGGQALVFVRWSPSNAPVDGS